MKYANAMNDDAIHSTQYIQYKGSYLGQFAVQTIETWQADTCSSTEIIPTAIKHSVTWQLTLF